jgi:general secretion pathway protein D
LDATLNLLETQNKAKVISTPRTVVQNGRQATIHVGQQYMYETVAAVPNGVPTYTTQTIDIGVTLQVQPKMSSDGVITLGITSVVSSLLGTTTGADGAQLPQVQETKSATTVQVHDGETLVIGGLKQDATSFTTTGVPFLMHLPLLGPLFQNKQSQPNDQELLILVTPESIKALAAGTDPSTLLAPNTSVTTLKRQGNK